MHFYSRIYSPDTLNSAHCFSKFTKESSVGKIGWAIIDFVLLMILGSNISAIIGVVAAYVLYAVYKSWNISKETMQEINLKKEGKQEEIEVNSLK
ncbi:hypothetical protein [Cytobacillus sp. IB215316]|uniref:lmo0954 family membrane protein n=1 Tax=Cytobacillus sp. IB215316 TaxID=3097354 RepID=UPI002A17D020|nr:hypothetical protein [Cytobacillus sp. IB215316]MDX8363315.1 hypothetical protein [Cytobacillus sp. IB215316]